jgi:hypothetical protein
VYHEWHFFLSKTTGGVNLIGLLDVVDEQVFFKWEKQLQMVFCVIFLSSCYPVRFDHFVKPMKKKHCL